VRIQGTDQAEVAEVTALEGGDLEVRLFRAHASGAPAGDPWFLRRFRPRDTSEVRLDLLGGDDRVVVRGQSPIRVRVLGGAGDDGVDDSAAGETSFADWEGHNEVVPGRRTRVDARPYTPPVERPDRPWIPPRDWGGEYVYVPWYGFSPELLVFLGLGVQRNRYALRTHPYGTTQLLRVGFATGPRAFRVDYEADLRRENAGDWFTLSARFSQVEILRFYGFGNDTPSAGPDSFFDVEQQQVSLVPLYHLPLARKVTLAFGPKLAYATTRLPADTFIGEQRPYGSGPFGEVGATAEVRLDTRDLAAAPTRGVLLFAGGTFHPAVWDVRQRFGDLHAEAASHLTAPWPLRPTLSLRAAVQQVLGEYPFHEAAFIGGHSSVRGFSSERFAGDGRAWGNAELRLNLGRYFFVLPGEYGLFALVDTGRVWLAGEHSDTWHTGAGGGLWFAPVLRSNTLTIAVARSAERTGLYLRTGFTF
jgi:hypothetical protein